MQLDPTLGAFGLVVICAIGAVDIACRWLTSLPRIDEESWADVPETTPEQRFRRAEGSTE